MNPFTYYVGFPGPDKTVRFAVCDDRDGEHKHDVIPAALFRLDDELVTKDDDAWCTLCRIGRGYDRDLLTTLRAMGAVEKKKP